MVGSRTKIREEPEMAELVTYAEPTVWYEEVPRSVKSHVRWGMFLLIFGLGGFGINQ